MNQFEKTLQELEKEGSEARLITISFLKYYKWEKLTARQLLKVLEIIKEEE